MALPVLTELEKKSIWLQLVNAWSSPKELIESINKYWKSELTIKSKDKIGFCALLDKTLEVRKYTQPILDMYDSDRNTRQLDDVIDDIDKIRLHTLKQMGFIPKTEGGDFWYSSFDERVKELERLKNKYK